jgi:hypothetical protein
MGSNDHLYFATLFNEKELHAHIVNVCRPNIKRNTKICDTCPFRHIVDEYEAGEI